MIVVWPIFGFSRFCAVSVKLKILLNELMRKSSKRKREKSSKKKKKRERKVEEEEGNTENQLHHQFVTLGRGGLERRRWWSCTHQQSEVEVFYVNYIYIIIFTADDDLETPVLH